MTSSSNLSPRRLLILGGSGEARQLAQAIAQDAQFAATYSLAGRTQAPKIPAMPIRYGGFGGVQGLCDYLRAQRIALLLDATHPFAAQMSHHAVLAAAQTGVRLLRLNRPAWQAQTGDQWQLFENMPAAAEALAQRPAQRVFLTIGQRDIAPFQNAPQHTYLIRSVEPIPTERLPPHTHCLLQRGPFDLAHERSLLQQYRVDTLLSKNSGGNATAAKLLAARELGIAVMMIQRPALDKSDKSALVQLGKHAACVDSIDDALAYLHRVAW